MTDKDVEIVEIQGVQELLEIGMEGLENYRDREESAIDSLQTAYERLDGLEEEILDEDVSEKLKEIANFAGEVSEIPYEERDTVSEDEVREYLDKAADVYNSLQDRKNELKDKFREV